MFACWVELPLVICQYLLQLSETFCFLTKISACTILLELFYLYYSADVFSPSCHLLGMFVGGILRLPSAQNHPLIFTGWNWGWWLHWLWYVWVFLLYSQVETGDSDRGICEECFFVQPEGLHNPSSGSCTFYQRCTPSSHYLFGCLVKITSYLYNVHTCM